jgi:hypothetical protein
MSVIGFLKGAVDTLSGGLVGQIGDILDKTSTSDEERMQMKMAIEKQVQEYTLQLTNQLQTVEQQLTDRQKNDMASDSWLSKNVRPLTMVFLTLSVVVLAYLSIFALDAGKVALLSPWIDTLKDLLQTVFVFYFGSRGFEKITQMVGSSFVKSKQ